MDRGATAPLGVVGAVHDNERDARRRNSVRGKVIMDADGIYRMSGIEYSYDELCEAVEGEAATLPPETWRGGEFNLRDYLIEAIQVGIIEQIDPEDAQHHV
jgi:hypothetical protein